MKNDWMNVLSDFVRENRRKIGMSQSLLADLTGMNTSYISRLESRDNFQSVKIDFFIRLCKAFEVDVNETMKTVGLL